MSKLRILISAAALATAATVSPVARADAPAPGDACTVLHATTQDANNRTMWCNPTMTGAHNLVWQYGGPAD
ncbi:hypothetical protein [Mycobacterium nebraskense]|uniref:Uncharacterized protein n=1 Tax=Mycobacterium nebraskense TaxID=244292 RepID=A0A1X1ZX17_9MYCO|nr:hypothetical protein [Mycobacterium nebraskense]KKC06527.1 hypothetical protein WU83_02705 [Mycobacterium nebraskense]MBI2697305.1 hypothetical protein [Mycobacterium nebraskense]MCV7120738.1 hypothetical protein [Mycobacterium nebraskense]ORW28942.1 hypothetical protein AWC17_00880 [Mycobacterium nebraskense]